MKILLLNWRDIRHPEAGGAEKVTHEVLKELVQAGHTVEWFAAGGKGLARRETLDGITITRMGKKPTVHLRAFFRYFTDKAFRDADVVIDEINTIPFLTPLYFRRAKIYVFVHQLAREVWFYETPFPLSLIGYAVEPFLYLPYRTREAITVSSSTKEDLERMGLRQNIHIIPVATDSVNLPAVSKEPEPTFIFIGRLTPSKRVDHIIEAFALFTRRRGKGALWIVGPAKPQYANRLVRLAQKRGVGSRVTFFGTVSREKKFELLARAHALVLASVREGWGIVVREANLVGTPAIGYAIPGLRDSIQHGQNGLLASVHTPAALVKLMEEIEVFTLRAPEPITNQTMRKAFLEIVTRG